MSKNLYPALDLARFYQGKSVFVPGGAGFIGSHLVERLLALGARVQVLDNFQTGRRENLPQEVEIVEGCITSATLPAADLIFNLACPASPVHYQRDPIGTWKSSVLGALNILETARQTGARVIHSSTSEVYGDPLEHPQAETYWGNVNPVGRRACYDEGKRAAETLIMDYVRVHHVDARIPRIFNTYGPRMAIDDGRVVSNFIVQALTGQALTFYGDGTTTRSFCYVTDMVEALLRLGAVDGQAGCIVNLGNPAEFSLTELAQMVRRITGCDAPKSQSDRPVDDPKMRKPDISLAGEILNWAPRISLDKGLEMTVQHFKSRLVESGVKQPE